MNEPTVWLFSDGSCGSGQELGTWTCFLATSTERKLLVGTACPTTISRMELVPIIEGLVWLRKNWLPNTRGVHVKVHSDSEYTIKTLCGIYEPKKNLDLWEGAKIAAQGFKMEYVWFERCQLDYMSLCDSTCTALREGTIELINMIFEDYMHPEKAIMHAPLPGKESV